MRRARIFFALLLVCACGVWIYNISLMAHFKTPGVSGIPASARRAEAAVSGASSLVDRALDLNPAGDVLAATGGFENPFKPISEAYRAQSSGPRRAATPVSRPRLVLKGILYKASPLAILENSRGTTSILAIGDTLDSQTITAITKTSVTLKDKRGTYELSVKE
jgi:hypothetical protein